MIRPAVAQRLWRGKCARPFSATNPISVSGDIGINLAAGIADLDLNYAG
jgi:hypothetical protein